VLDFSRIVQDAPFAMNNFGAIANNFDPLVQSYGRLSEEAKRLSIETGKNVSTFSLLSQSLIGGAGVGLAISTVTSLITAAQMKYGSLGTAIRDIFGTISNLEKATTALDKAQTEANKSAGEEIARMQVLALVASDITRSTEKRGQATDELQKILKANNVELSREAILNGQSAEAIEKATDAILKRARARAVEARLSELQTQRLDLEIKESNAITNLTNKQAEFNKELKAGRLNERSRGFFLRTAVDEIDDVKKGLKDIDEQIAFTLAKVNIDKIDPIDPKKLKEGEDLLKKQLDFIEKIRDAAKEFQGKLFDLKDIDAATNKLASLEQQVGNLKLQIAVRDAKKAGLPPAEIEKLKDAIKQDTQKRLNEAFEKEALLLEFSAKLKFSRVNRAELPDNIDSAIAKATGLDKKIPVITLHEVRVKILGAKLTSEIEFKEGLQRKLQEELNSIIANLRLDSVTTLAESIGNALVNGDIKNIFKSLFDVIASGLQQFGKALIAYGVAQKAFQVATKSLNPAIAIAAGAGLIVAGAALRAALPKFATGGIINGPVIGQIGEMHRPEVILPLDRLPQMLRSIGGSGGNDMQLIPIINNEGLYLAMKRGERRAGRKF
jgi:predicted house-cleaning noncanonical NTP pyrophosphatase (MazG superfamily)